MLDNPTIQKLRDMNLKNMADIMSNPDITTSELTFEERFAFMVESEWLKRKNTRIARLVKCATLSIDACIEDVDYDDYRKLDKEIIRKLSTCLYIEQNLNIIISGKTGSGKTYLACALGNIACRKNYTVKYYRIPELLLEMQSVKSENRYNKFMSALIKIDLLILDDIGIKEYEQEESRDLLEIVESRYNKASTIFVSQIPHANWYELFTDPTLADAFLDRIVHNSYIVPIDSKKSLREVTAQRKMNQISENT